MPISIGRGYNGVVMVELVVQVVNTVRSPECNFAYIFYRCRHEGNTDEENTDYVVFYEISADQLGNRDVVGGGGRRCSVRPHPFIQQACGQLDTQYI